MMNETMDKSKRKSLLFFISTGSISGILAVSKANNKWTKPIIDAVILPAHAQTSCAAPTDEIEGPQPPCL